jgi:hypothetical protein
LTIRSTRRRRPARLRQCIHDRRGGAKGRRWRHVRRGRDDLGESRRKDVEARGPEP